MQCHILSIRGKTDWLIVKRYICLLNDYDISMLYHELFVNVSLRHMINVLKTKCFLIFTLFFYKTDVDRCCCKQCCTSNW
jgi:hypothetical protein